MPAKSRRPISVDINLVPQDPFFESSLGRVLRWALSVGRYIVIFTELVVVLSFVTRFSLDRTLTDLNDEIHRKELVVKSYGTLEEEFRTLQDKITQFEQLEQQTNLVDIFPHIAEIIPENVELKELSITQTTVLFKGAALSQIALNTLIANLQLSPLLFDVTVDTIESQGERTPGFAFSIRATTKAAPKVVTAPAAKASPGAEAK